MKTTSAVRKPKLDIREASVVNRPDRLRVRVWVRAWNHSPEGQCVADAGVRSDKRSRLRWFEYVALKREGCFEAHDVHIAVSTVNTGELRPFREYRRPIWDHLIARRAWTPWVRETD